MCNCLQKNYLILGAETTRTFWDELGLFTRIRSFDFKKNSLSDVP